MIGRRGPREVGLSVKVNVVDPITFGVRRRVKGFFQFRQKDPFAVHLTFFDKKPVPWCFARELLVGGTTMPEGVGHGDITIWPIPWDDYQSFVGMIVGNGPGATTMTMRMKPIRNFIRAMDRIVPLDRASDGIDIDKELAWIQDKLF